MLRLIVASTLSFTTDCLAVCRPAVYYSFHMPKKTTPSTYRGRVTTYSQVRASDKAKRIDYVKFTEANIGILFNMVVELSSSL